MLEKALHVFFWGVFTLDACPKNACIFLDVFTSDFCQESFSAFFFAALQCTCVKKTLHFFVCLPWLDVRFAKIPACFFLACLPCISGFKNGVICRWIHHAPKTADAYCLASLETETGRLKRNETGPSQANWCSRSNDARRTKTNNG